MTDLQWTSTETKSSQKLNNSPFHNFTADAYNHNQTINDQTSQNHFFPCYITGYQSPKCTLPHPCEVYNYEGTFFHGPCARITQKSPCWNPNQFSRIPEPGSRLTGCCASQQKPSREYLPINWDFMSTILVNFCTVLAHISLTNLKWNRQLHSKKCTLYRTGVTRWRV